MVHFRVLGAQQGAVSISFFVKEEVGGYGPLVQYVTTVQV